MCKLPEGSFIQLWPIVFFYRLILHCSFGQKRKKKQVGQFFPGYCFELYKSILFRGPARDPTLCGGVPTREEKNHCFEALWTEKGASPFPAGWRAEKAQKTMRVCPKAQKPKAKFFLRNNCTITVCILYYSISP